VIYRAVDWIARLESFALPDARHPLLGGPTMCVTTIHGGLNINSVPDSVTFTIDFRSIPSNSHGLETVLALFSDNKSPKW
jgi:succinyl-diaminopimelate desuccinylase